MDLILIHAEAETLVRAAVQFEEKHYHFEAEKALLRARELYTTLLEIDFDGHVAGLSRLLALLGKVYTSERKFRQAAAIFDAAEALVGQESAEVATVIIGRARLHSMMGDSAAAVLNWEQLLQLERLESAEKAIAYQHLAEMAGEGGHQETAIDYFDKAVEVSSGQELILGGTLLSYGSFLSRIGQQVRAKAMLLLAKVQFGSAAGSVSMLKDEHWPLVLFNLINVHNELGEKEDADRILTELKTLEAIYRNLLAEAFEPLHGAIYARILGWFGVLYVREKDVEAARKMYTQQVEVYQKLELINPGSYLGRLAAALHDLGTVYRNESQFKDASNAYNEAIMIRRKLAEEYPAMYEPMLARNIMSLARLYLRMDDKWQSGMAIQGAVTVFEGLAGAHPEIYAKELAACYKVLGQLLYDNRDRSGARDIWLKWIPLQERLAEKDPVNEEQNLFVALRSMVRYHLHYNRFGEAEPYFDRLLAVKEKYKAFNPGTFDGDLGFIYGYMANSATMQATLPEAEVFFQRSIQHYKTAVMISPEDYKADYVHTLKDLAKVYADMAGNEPSVTFLQKQLSVYELLEPLVPGRYRSAMAEVLTNMGSAYADADEFAAGIAVRKRADEIYAGLVESGDGVYKPLLADNLFWLAILYSHSEDFVAADETYRRCVTIYEQVIEETDEAFTVKYANVLMYYGKFLVGQGRVEEGRSILEKAAVLIRSSSADNEAKKILESVRE